MSIQAQQQQQQQQQQHHHHNNHQDDGGYRSEPEDNGDGNFVGGVGGDMTLGGANAKAMDDKQRKRIIQACEPCRIRKAKVSQTRLNDVSTFDCPRTYGDGAKL